MTSSDPNGAGRTPESIGPYRIQRLIGSGGMGEVYLAEQREPFERVVAVKLVRPDKASAERLDRFHNEIHALAALSHDSIAKIFDAGRDGDRPYFAMEYVPGRHVTEYCAEERLDLGSRLRLFVQVCEAVAHAHRNGIVHRDLKPSNILAHGPANAPAVKIIDFGLAKLLRPPGERGLTETVAVLGSLEYMSPEQVDASHDVDTRADVYALGAILYELLTGALPLALRVVDLAAYPAAYEMIRRRTPSTPSARVAEANADSDSWARGLRLDSHRKLSRSLAGDLDVIVMKALAKDPRERYATVEQFADDVELFLRAEPIRARPRTSGYVLRKLLQRNRRLVAVAAPIAVLLLLSLAVSGIVYARGARDRAALRLLGLTRVLENLMEEDLTDPPPARPDSLPALRAWKEQLDAVRAERPAMAAFLNAPEPSDSPPADLHRQLRSAFSETLDFLDELERPNGYIEAFQRRTEWAERVADLTVTRRADAWRRALDELAADTRFTGVDLRPQVGLIPIGADPKTGLQEFALPIYGCEVPRRDGEGRLVVVGNTCPVFVLLPGDDFVVGSQDEDPDRPRYDPHREPFEPELRTVRIEPFFASKYEFTNGQWSALNPDALLDPAFELHGLTRPAVMVTDFAVEHVVRAWGMRLPTASEWEYLARAGTDTPWWCGAEADALRGAVNVYDRSLAEAPDLKGEGRAVPWSDDFELTAPVDALQANGFALFHVLGNALEIVRADDPEPDAPVYDMRGGSWHGGAAACRATWRNSWFGEPKEAIGFRPVISVRR